MSIRHGLLALLDRQPMYGYLLRAEFEASTGSTWPLNVGQVYTTLARLERDGLVESVTGEAEAQRAYAITARGREEVRRWFATPVPREAPPRDELAIKLAIAITTQGVDERTVIQTQRTATVRALQEYTRLKSTTRDAELPWLLVLDSLVFAAEAEVRWLDHCEARLARHRGAGGTTSAPTPAALEREQEVRR